MITWALYPAPTPSERWLQEQQDQWNLRVAEARGDAKKMVMASLRDPYSAVLGELVTHEIILDNKSVMAVCGSINAKNGFGGYVGERRSRLSRKSNRVRYERTPSSNGYGLRRVAADRSTLQLTAILQTSSFRLTAIHVPRPDMSAEVIGH